MTTLAALSVAPMTMELPREFRGAWIATVDNIDWPTRRDLTTEQQRAELTGILNRAAELRLNALVFQVRPTADALYASDKEPWSEYLTGQQGRPPSPLWDPLAFMVEEGHRRGIEIHAWFNPYRSWHPAAKGTPSASHISQTHPDSVHQYGRFQWMDPADPYVQQHSLDVVLDVVKRYDVDGVHVDDYFYPYPDKDPQGNKLEFPDQGLYDAYLAKGGKLARDDWRREQVNGFIHRLYDGIKREKRWVKFGISPFGIGRPGNPPSIEGFDQYTQLYADAIKWFNEGWCDYFTPQCYWPIAQTKQSFTTLIEYWATENKKNRHLWPGMFTSQIARQNANWNRGEVVNQIEATRSQAGVSGHVHFSFRVFTENAKELNELLTANLYAVPALVPASPWLDRKVPAAPTIGEIIPMGNGIGVRVAGIAPDGKFVLMARNGQILSVVSVNDPVLLVHGNEMNRSGLDSIYIFVVDRTGNLSAGTLIPPQ